MKIRSFYNQALRVAQAGALVAPLMGVHGIRFRLHAEPASDWPNLQLSIKPVGFWTEVISLRFDPRREEFAVLSWSSGGRDYEEEADDKVAAWNFAIALQAAVHVSAAWERIFRTKEGE